MTPLYETGRFPKLNFILHLLASFPIGFLAAYIALLCWKGSSLYTSDGFLTFATSAVLGAIVAIVSGVCFYFLSEFIAEHLAGRELFSDSATNHTLYADAFAITTAYVLPYADNGYTRSGEPYCELHLSYSYQEIRQAYDYLCRKHRLVYRLSSLSLPSHLGKRTLLLSRASARQILATMSASASAHPDTPISAERVVLRYPFYPTYSSRITLPEHQVFLSRQITYDLLDSIRLLNAPITPGSSVTVSTDINVNTPLTAQYLHDCAKRIATDDELIYLPIR